MNRLSRRQALQGLAAFVSLPIVSVAARAATPELAWQAWRTDADDFFRAPILLTGRTEAILLDGGFNYAQGRALAARIQTTGKRLSTIYISCSDPDYYFNLGPVKAAFPDAKVLAAPETIAAIRGNVARKIATWGPKLGANGPQRLDEIVFASPHDAPGLEFDGHAIDIVTSRRMSNRRYLWVPSLEAVFGGVYVLDGLHVWTADTPTPAERGAWVLELEALIARRPKIVVAGHAAAGVDNGVAALRFTRDYLLAYEQEVARAANSAELIAAMKRRYPGLGLEAGLEIGAKVAKGEMTWG